MSLSGVSNYQHVDLRNCDGQEVRQFICSPAQVYSPQLPTWLSPSTDETRDVHCFQSANHITVYNTQCSQLLNFFYIIPQQRTSYRIICYLTTLSVDKIIYIFGVRRIKKCVWSTGEIILIGKQYVLGQKYVPVTLSIWNPPPTHTLALTGTPILCSERPTTNRFPWEDQLHGESWFNSDDVERSKISKLTKGNDSIASFSVRLSHCCTEKSQHRLIVPPGIKQHWRLSRRRETQQNDSP